MAVPVLVAVLAALLVPERGYSERADGASASGSSDAVKPLVVRVSDAIGTAGGRVAVVLRTYAPRPMGQGQMCVVVRPNGGAASAARVRPDQQEPGLRDREQEPAEPRERVYGVRQRVPRSPRAAAAATGGAPFDRVNVARAFAGAGDGTASAQLELEGGAQMVLVSFQSASGTLNAVDGPFAAVDLQLAAGLDAAQELVLEIDPVRSFLIDAAGQPAPLVGRSGTLEFRQADEPFRVEADGDSVTPGETARIGLDTFEPFAIGGGQVAFRFDPALPVGTPVVSMDPRHGNSRFVVDIAPGLVVVTFASDDGSLNDTPGELVSVDLPVSREAPVGALSPVTLDPDLTVLLDPGGQVLPIELEGGRLEVR